VRIGSLLQFKNWNKIENTKRSLPF
jgi:hypothetical protein